MTVSTVFVFASPPQHRAQSSPWGDAAVEGSGWRQWEGDVVVWQDGGTVSLSRFGVLEPKALGQGHGYSRRMAQVA